MTHAVGIHERRPHCTVMSTKSLPGQLVLVRKTYWGNSCFVFPFLNNYPNSLLFSKNFSLSSSFQSGGNVCLRFCHHVYSYQILDSCKDGWAPARGGGGCTWGCFGPGTFCQHLLAFGDMDNHCVLKLWKGAINAASGQARWPLPKTTAVPRLLLRGNARAVADGRSYVIQPWLFIGKKTVCRWAASSGSAGTRILDS